MAKVIISAGHSPVDKGAVIGDLVEYDLTRKITDALEDLIKDYPKLDYKRIPTGLSLPQKIQWINSSGRFAENNDISVEVHINDKGGEGSEDGVECWYAERGENASRKLCTELMNCVCEESGMRRRSVNSEYDHPFRRLGYVHNTRTISALIEIGFMDNPKDKKILTSNDGVKKIAKGLLKGILEYYGLKEGDKDVEPEQKPNLPIHTDPGIGMMPQGMQNMGGIPNSFPMNALANYGNMFNNALPSGNTGGFAPNFNNQVTSSPQLSIDERKDMIQRLFQKVLGRNADPKSMRYYSASQVSEDALIKLMVDSVEHKNIIRAARDFVSTKSMLNRANREITELKSKLNDKEIEIDSLRKFYQNQKASVSETLEVLKEDSDLVENDEISPEIEEDYVVASSNISKETTEIHDERFRHGSEKKKTESVKMNNEGSSLNTYSLKTIKKPAGPFKAIKKLIISLGQLVVGE